MNLLDHRASLLPHRITVGLKQGINGTLRAACDSKETSGPVLEICLSYLKMIGLLLNLVVCHRFPYSNGKFGGLSY